MTAAIDMVPRKLPGGDSSHTGSWAYLRANQLKHVGIDALVLSEKGRGIATDWSEFDTVYVYHTMDFAPEHPYLLNVFDGPQEHVAKYFERFIWKQHEKIKFISLDYPMPNYGYRCKRKRDRASEDTKMSDYWKNVDWDALQVKCDSITDWILDPGVTMQVPLSFADYHAGKRVDPKTIIHKWRKLTIGDSHSHSAYTPESLVLRKDGRTMAGITKKSIQKEVTDYGFDWDQLDELTCYWGNIDIRHHLCREGDPIANAITLVDNYAEMLKKTGKSIEVVCPLPIEDESRKLPSTGYYLGTPFIGSRKQRQDVLDAFWTRLSFHAAANGWKTFRWPENWYKMDGMEFIAQMETPRSVHLARKNYRWDLEHDVLNSVSNVVQTKSLLEF
jgi:hypothetical protein